MSVLDIEKFYNKFSSNFIKDYIYGNKRIQRQMEFFKNAIPKNAENVLVIGCGSGQTAFYIAKRCAKRANILAVDISSEALRIGKSIFRHDRVKYQKSNILTGSIGGEWNVVVLPDTYEHIPLDSRNLLHSKVSKLLHPRGRILITVPSPYYQAYLRRKHPEELQVVDETIELVDLMGFADDVSGVLSYFNIISVWSTNDYIHAVIERNIGQIHRLKNENSLPIKGLQKSGILSRGGSCFLRKIKLTKLAQWFRHIRVMRALKTE